MGVVTVTDGEDCQVYKATMAWKVDESQKLHLLSFMTRFDDGG